MNRKMNTIIALTLIIVELITIKIKCINIILPISSVSIYSDDLELGENKR